MLLVKDYNNFDETVVELKAVVDQVAYDVLWVGTWPKLPVSEERVAEIAKIMKA